MGDSSVGILCYVRTKAILCPSVWYNQLFSKKFVLVKVPKDISFFKGVRSDINLELNYVRSDLWVR